MLARGLFRMGQQASVGMERGRRRLQILALFAMAVVGVGLGVWLFRAGYTGLGCGWIALFVWWAQQSLVWLVTPSNAPSDDTAPLASRGQKVLLAIIWVLGAAVCGVGVYVWRLWPEEWQAGLVFVLFGLIFLAPVTVKEIRSGVKQS
jgi:hypothetical protein